MENRHCSSQSQHESETHQPIIDWTHLICPLFFNASTKYDSLESKDQIHMSSILSKNSVINPTSNQYCCEILKKTQNSKKPKTIVITSTSRPEINKSEQSGLKSVAFLWKKIPAMPKTIRELKNINL